MRKIISIVLTLGVILGLTAFAAPVAAAPCVCPTGSTPVIITDALGPPSFCAGELSTYVVGPFVIPIAYLANTDSFALEFPAGTDLSGVAAAGVSILSVANGPGVATSITVVGTELFVKVPAGFLAVTPPNDSVTITVVGVKNTITPDTYCLYTGYMDDCCTATYTDCGTFTVVPNVCTLDFVFDFSPTYVGVAEGFIPPFKACGQEDFGTLNATVGWMTDFALNITPVVPGCHPPCDAVKWFFVVDAVEPGGVITFNDGINIMWTLTALDIGDLADPLTHKVINGALNLSDPCAELGPFPMSIHFSTPGDYQITFYLECPAVTCGPGSAIIADEPLPAKVYQYKEAIKIPLYRKWNLISLPLVPLEDPNPIEDVLAAYANEADVLSVHYYDACGGGAWKVYSAGQTSLATMEDGKSYWVMIDYSHTVPAEAPGTAHDGLWVWGNRKTVPPDSPSAYQVCTGWNMVGLTGFADPLDPNNKIGLTQTTDFAYLWNWMGTFWFEWGVIYGWDAAAPQGWFSVMPGALAQNLPNLPRTGEGYWIDFAHDGFVYPP